MIKMFYYIIIIVFQIQVILEQLLNTGILVSSYVKNILFMIEKCTHGLY